MKQCLDIISQLHTKTKRAYLERMMDDKVHCMKVAKKYAREYWDGNRRFGYGGYHYDGRWQPIAKRLITHYNLLETTRVLDVGCGRAFLPFEIKKILPKSTVTGFDISQYAINTSKEEIKDTLFVHNAAQPYPLKNNSFDLVISLTTLHNLLLPELIQALKEMERVGRNKYLVIESYRNEQELFNLQCWALTCESFFRPDEWEWIFEQAGYAGDYEFIYFEG